MNTRWVLQCTEHNWPKYIGQYATRSGIYTKDLQKAELFGSRRLAEDDRLRYWGVKEKAVKVLVEVRLA